jgi:hypothetical protein
MSGALTVEDENDRRASRRWKRSFTGVQYDPVRFFHCKRQIADNLSTEKRKCPHTTHPS